MSSPPYQPRSKKDLGTLGETLVAKWLMTQGWRLQTHQWHCIWGEIDLIMVQDGINLEGQIAFVEVKTRSQGNWDADGLMAITRNKQRKLWRAAQLYLLNHHPWARAICRFDVALVVCRWGTPPLDHPERHLTLEDGRYLTLQDYIDSAFDAPQP